jgi:hypothetical protein
MPFVYVFLAYSKLKKQHTKHQNRAVAHQDDPNALKCFKILAKMLTQS